MSKRNRNKGRKESWFKHNAHLVAWASVLVSVISVAVTIALANNRPKSQISIQQVFSSILEPRIYCSEQGWVSEQIILEGFMIRNNGDKRSTISQGVLVGSEFPEDENVKVYAEPRYFNNESDYLAFIDSHEPLLSPFNFRDTEQVAFSIPLTIEPGITKNLMVELFVQIVVKSGEPFDIIAFRDKHDWNLKYVFDTSEAPVLVEVNLAAIPMFGPQLGKCPPAILNIPMPNQP